MDKKYHIGPNGPLHEQDSENQTYGCRCFNPDICKNNGNKECAFYSEDHICRTPSKRWKKIYLDLKTKSDKK